MKWCGEMAIGVWRASWCGEMAMGVWRASGPGGVADGAAQDAYCATAAGGCTIAIIYDQSPNQNHLRAASKPHMIKNRAVVVFQNGASKPTLAM